jgi:hypothetical protein
MFRSRRATRPSHATSDKNVCVDTDHPASSSPHHPLAASLVDRGANWLQYGAPLDLFISVVYIIFSKLN